MTSAPRFPTRLRDVRGVGLVEIMVAMVVFGVIGLSLANLLRESTRISATRH